MSGLLLAHLRNRLLRYEKVPGHIRTDHHFEILGRIVSEWLRNIDARVVDKKVNAAKVFDGSLRHFDRHILFADVAVNQNKVGGRFQIF